MDTNKAKEFFNSLPVEQQTLIDKVLLSTIDMSNELQNTDLIFFEDVAYRLFRYEMLEHMLNDEFYDPKQKNWRK